MTAPGDQPEEYAQLNNLTRMEWVSLGDPVMGGCSEGSATPDEDGSLCFEGVVRLDNGGGFASVKADLDTPLDLSGWKGIQLRVKGDGRHYKLGLRLSTNRNSPVYQHRVATEAGQWQTLHLAFRDFEASLRGKKRPEAPPLDPTSIWSLSLFVSERQAGAFRLLLY